MSNLILADPYAEPTPGRVRPDGDRHLRGGHVQRGFGYQFHLHGDRQRPGQADAAEPGHGPRGLASGTLPDGVAGTVATVAALGAASIGNIVKMWMNVMGFFAAPILSLFLLGLLTRRASFAGWLVGLVCGMGLTVFLKFHFGEQLMPIWFIPCSFVVCSLVGYGASVLMPASGMADAREESRFR